MGTSCEHNTSKKKGALAQASRWQLLAGGRRCPVGGHPPPLTVPHAASGKHKACQMAWADTRTAGDAPLRREGRAGRPPTVARRGRMGRDGGRPRTLLVRRGDADGAVARNFGAVKIAGL